MVLLAAGSGAVGVACSAMTMPPSASRRVAYRVVLRAAPWRSASSLRRLAVTGVDGDAER